MSTFLVKNKVAIVTGGSGEIGWNIAKELLKNGAKGVTLADNNKELGDNAVQKLENTFGKTKAIFVTTDVRDIEQFEDVFLKTIKAFKNVDIIVNNAGILNNQQWSNEIDTHVKGTVNGMLLGLEKYLQTSKSGNESVILNFSSTAEIQAKGSIPVYSSSKYAIHGMTLAWGTQSQYSRTKVKVVAICLGSNTTNLLSSVEENNVRSTDEGPKMTYEIDDASQTAKQCAKGAIQVIEHAETGTVWIVEEGETPYQFTLSDRYKRTEKKYIKG